jgi:hypothetical protein
MGTCRIHTGANHRNCSPAPVQFARDVPGPYQPPAPGYPPFLSILMKQKMLDP